MTSTKYTHNSYLQQILWSKFLSTSYETSKTDRSGGLTVPIGEMLLGANYSEADYNDRKAQIERQNFHSLTATDSTDLAIMSGDREVLDHWLACMNGRNGISASFVDKTSKRVVLRIQYHSTDTTSFDRLSYNVSITPALPASHISDPFGCLERGRVIKQNQPCDVELTMNSAFDVITVRAQADRSSDEASLPRRIQLNRVPQFYSFASSDIPVSNGHNQHGTQPTFGREIHLTPAQMADGWSFDPSTAGGRVQLTYSHRGGECQNWKTSATRYSFSYSYVLWAPHRNHAHSAAATCAPEPSVQMVREVWVDRDERLDRQTPVDRRVFKVE